MEDYTIHMIVVANLLMFLLWVVFSYRLYRNNRKSKTFVVILDELMQHGIDYKELHDIVKDELKRVSRD